MFSAPPTAAVAAIQAVVVAGPLLLLGYLIADRLVARWDPHWAARWALAFPALVTFALVIMVAHIATGGAILSRPGLVRAITFGVAAILLALKVRARARRATPRLAEAAAVVVIVVMGAVLWGWPVTQSLPLPHISDTRLHMGWAAQLLNGESTPSAPITGDIPNYYPWMYHAVVAFLACFVPGGRAFHALAPLQLLQVTGVLLALFALGRQLTGRWLAGAAAALFGGLMGGVGYVLASGPDAVLPRTPEGEAALDYLGDLVIVRSYSFPFQNLAPPFPRNLSFTLLVAFVLLLVMGMERRSLFLLGGGGLLLGTIGLTGGETFFVGVGLVAIVAVWPRGSLPLRGAAVVWGVAAAVYALWFVPTAISYVRLGGFVDITIVPPVTLPAHAILVSWGIATPFAVYAGIRWARGRDRDEMRIPVALGVTATAVMLLAGVMPHVVGDAFEMLGRHHRYWPLVHLGIVLAAALGAARLVDEVWSADRRAAVAVAAGITAAAIPSPLLASLALADRVPVQPLLASALRGRPDALFNIASPVPGRRCVAAAGSRYDLLLFSYTGYRLVRLMWSPAYAARPNKARVRWRDIYDHVPGDAERGIANAILTRGEAAPEQWLSAARAHGVDVALVPLRRADRALLASLPHEEAAGLEGDAAVVRVGDCRPGA